ncbi:glycosyltransferase family 4 protein [candidate division WOR-3 bacterium]|nr:glycosyltransferase family 4 protein [candidate division WOR-3 bacterium]
MKVLIIARYFYPPRRGAERALMTLAKELARNNTVFALCYGKGDMFLYKEILIHQKALFIERKTSYLKSILNIKKWEKVIDKEVKEIKPDLILTQLVLSTLSIKIAQKYAISSFVFLHSYEPFCFNAFVNGTDCDKKCFKCFKTPKEKIKHIFYKEELRWYKFVLKKATLVISNSKFMRDLCKRWYGIESTVISPFIQLKDYLCNNSSLREKVTFIIPEVIKGAKIFLELSKILKSRKFLVIGKAKENDIKKELKSIPNVEYIEEIENMKRVYRRTKILIAPSICPEPFSRACVEAMANGIPCIVSNRGGLPEVVGNAGIIIENPYDIDSWIRAIKSLENDKLYLKLSLRSKRQAKKFAFELSYKKFMKLTEHYASNVSS